MGGRRWGRRDDALARPRRPRWLLPWGLALVLVTGACGGGSGAEPGDAQTRPEPSPSIRTLTPIPLPPDPPPSGRLLAEIRQSSRDAALGRAQVWIENDTARAVTPTSITYGDPRFRTPLPGERLRTIPSRAERGYPLTLPSRPRCDADREPTVTLRVAQRSGVRAVRVVDPTDVMGRYVAARCTELAVTEVVGLSWAEQVPADLPGADSVGTLVLRAEPTGRPGPRVRLLTISGTPLFTPADGGVWRPGGRRGVALTGPAAPTRIRLPVRPARCDGHAFLEAGGGTAFRLRLRVAGRPGQLVLRMTPDGAAAAIAFARTSCGLG